MNDEKQSPFKNIYENEINVSLNGVKWITLTKLSMFYFVWKVDNIIGIFSSPEPKAHKVSL